MQCWYAIRQIADIKGDYVQRHTVIRAERQQLIADDDKMWLKSRENRCALSVAVIAVASRMTVRPPYDKKWCRYAQLICSGKLLSVWNMDPYVNYHMITRCHAITGTTARCALYNDSWQRQSDVSFCIVLDAPSPMEPPAHIRIYLIFLATRIIGLYFATNDIDLSSFKFFWCAP